MIFVFQKQHYDLIDVAFDWMSIACLRIGANLIGPGLALSELSDIQPWLKAAKDLQNVSQGPNMLAFPSSLER